MSPRRIVDRRANLGKRVVDGACRALCTNVGPNVPLFEYQTEPKFYARQREQLKQHLSSYRA